MKKSDWIKIKGKIRLLFGNCPKCNSDAPKMWNCNVCDFKLNYNNRSKKEDRKYWWNRFLIHFND